MILDKQPWLALIICAIFELLSSCASSVHNNNRPNVIGPILHPGRGFSEPTPEPGQIGNSTAKVIARWDVVPYQAFSGTLKIGVVAFHINGIDRVEFSLEDGPWVATQSMTLNPSTDVAEYWAQIEADDFAQSKAIEVRAIAYPTTGQPRLLDYLPLFVQTEGAPNSVIRYVSPGGNDNASGTSTTDPMGTIARAAQSIGQASASGLADGGTIYLMAGNHAYNEVASGANAVTRDTWLTIEAAPGLNRADVKLTSSVNPGLNIRLVRIRNVTVTAQLFTAAGAGHHIWFDHAHLTGNGPDQYQFESFFYGHQDEYLTDSELDNTTFGPRYFTLVRNCQIHDLGDDAFNAQGLVANVKVERILFLQAQGAHPDFLIPADWGCSDCNSIYFGVEALEVHAQGIYFGHGRVDMAPINNVAIVNLLLDTVPSDFVSQVEVPVNHWLIWNMTSNQSFQWRHQESGFHNISVSGSVFLQMALNSSPIPGYPGTGATSVNPLWFSDNHFINTGGNSITPGTGTSTGSAGFTDESNNNYQPSPGSVLNNRLFPLVPVDLRNNLRQDPTALGALVGVTND